MDFAKPKLILQSHDMYLFRNLGAWNKGMRDYDGQKAWYLNPLKQSSEHDSFL